MTDYGYYETDEPELVVGRGRGAQRLINATGALVSLSLVVGMGIWGYRLLVRDVSGVPVIEAMEGAFRTQPEDPGGMTAAHQGLQVNQIAALGATAGPVDEVRLAPVEDELAEEDAPWGELLETAAQEDTVPQDDAAPLGDAMDGLLAEMEDVPPLTELAADGAEIEATDLPEGGLVEDRPEDANPVDLAIAEALAGDIEMPVSSEKRPAPRPEIAGFTQVSASAEASIAAPAVASGRGGEVDVASLAKGTRLVQLGAYASPEIAREEWGKIAGRFADFFDDKRMVVQEAVSGGKTFFRLRAEGFEDLADARRFCSALTAAQADCIPVEVR